MEASARFRVIPCQNVERGVETFRVGEHDGVIALGGGSALDAGKAIAFLSGQDRPLGLEDLQDNWIANEDGIAPTIAIPLQQALDRRVAYGDHGY